MTTTTLPQTRPPSNFWEFVSAGIEHYDQMRKNTPSYRRGQAYANLFRHHFPHVSVPNRLDPFYRDDNLPEFLAFVYTTLEGA